jgi:hypothetical protein
MNGPPAQVPPNPKARRLKIVALIFVGLIALYSIYRYALARSIQTRIDAIHRARFPATGVELDKWYVQPPAGENAADVYTQAFAHYDAWTNQDAHFSPPAGVNDRTKYVAPPKEKRDLLPIFGEAKLPPDYGPLSEEQEKLVAEYLADNAKTLKLLHQAASMKYCRYPVDLTKGVMASSRHRGSLRPAEELLELEVIHALDQKQQAQAVESAVAALAAAHSLSQEPLLISYLFQVSYEGLALENIKRIVNTASLTDSQLVQLSAALQESDNVPSLMRALVGERCIQGDVFQDIRRGKTAIKELYTLVNSFHFANDEPELPILLVATYKISGLLDLDYRTYLDSMDGFVVASQFPPPQNMAAAQVMETIVQRLPRRRVLSRSFMTALDLAVVNACRNAAQLRNAQVVLAIERYRLANNKLPDQLSDLAPTFLASVPVDPFDGKPLRYKKLPDSYTVYSVGENRKDDYTTDIAFTVEE